MPRRGTHRAPPAIHRPLRGRRWSSVRRQPGEEGVDEALAAGEGRLLPHPTDGLRRDPEPHLAAVGVELGPVPEGPPVGFPAGGARRQSPGAARPVLALPFDNDRQPVVGPHVPPQIIHFEQVRTSRSATSGRSRRAALVAVWRESKIRGRIEKMRPRRVQTGKSGPCPRYRQMAQLRYRWPQVAIPRPAPDTCSGSPYKCAIRRILNTPMRGS